MDFAKILFMHGLIHIIFPNSSTELWPLIDFRIVVMLIILWINLGIWSNLVVILISTVAGYHVVLATLLLVLSWGGSFVCLMTCKIRIRFRIFILLKNVNNIKYFWLFFVNPSKVLEETKKNIKNIKNYNWKFWRKTNESYKTNEPCHEKTCLWQMRTTKAQISLPIRAVWSAPLLFAA